MLCLNILLIILLSSFYIMPMIEHMLSTNYEVFQEGRMSKDETLISYKVNLVDLIFTQKNAMIYEIGLVTIIGIILTLIARKKIDERYKKIYWFSLVMGILFIILSLDIFPFEKMPSVLKMIQFTFRFLEFSSFFLIFVAAVNYSVVIKNFNIRDVTIISIICVTLSLGYLNKLGFNKTWEEEDLFPAVAVNENTGRVHAGCATFEYLPSKAYENLDYIKERQNRVYILEGNTIIENEIKEGTTMEFEISETTEDTTLELPYIYYLGYSVTYITDEEEVTLETSESENGFVQINIKQSDSGKIIVKYTGTTIMKVSYAVSILTFLVSIIILIYTSIKKRGI